MKTSAWSLSERQMARQYKCNPQTVNRKYMRQPRFYTQTPFPSKILIQYYQSVLSCDQRLFRTYQQKLHAFLYWMFPQQNGLGCHDSCKPYLQVPLVASHEQHLLKHPARLVAQYCNINVGYKTSKFKCCCGPQLTSMLLRKLGNRIPSQSWELTVHLSFEPKAAGSPSRLSETLHFPIQYVEAVVQHGGQSRSD